jgi:hypothetical protein
MLAIPLRVVVPATVRAEDKVVASDKVIDDEPLSIIMLPVDAPPRVRVCILVVPRFPRPVKKVALLPELAEILAVGVPPATLVKANLAEEVPVPPKRISRVGLLG